MPTAEESIESQEKFKALKDNGLYEPVLGNKPPREAPTQKAKPLPQQKGRPEGTGRPKETDTKNPIGLTAEKQTRFSLTKIQDNLNLADKLNSEVEAF